jgi:hypothetical protein
MSNAADQVAGPAKPSQASDTVSPTPGQQARAAAIAAEITARLADVSFALPGTVADRMTRCGHPGCRCHADPPRPHGPYHQWTRKKTAGPRPASCPTTSSPTTAPGSTTTAACASSSPNSKPSASPSPRTTPLEPLTRPPRYRTVRATPKPEPRPPQNAGSTRLTCGQPSTQPSYAQVSPKREDLTSSEVLSEGSPRRGEPNGEPKKSYAPRMMDNTARRRGHGEDAIYFDAAKNRYVGASTGPKPRASRPTRRRAGPRRAHCLPC